MCKVNVLGALCKVNVLGVLCEVKLRASRGPLKKEYRYTHFLLATFHLSFLMYDI